MINGCDQVLQVLDPQHLLIWRILSWLWFYPLILKALITSLYIAVDNSNSSDADWLLVWSCRPMVQWLCGTYMSHHLLWMSHTLTATVMSFIFDCRHTTRVSVTSVQLLLWCTVTTVLYFYVHVNYYICVAYNIDASMYYIITIYLFYLFIYLFQHWHCQHQQHK